MKHNEPSIAEFIVKIILLAAVGYVAIIWLSMMAPAGG
jgi:hypothetical protein